MAGAATTLTIGLGNQLYEVAAGEGLTFGRSPRTTLCLDPTDLGISRVAGSLEADAGVWWLVNKSTVRPLEVVDDVGIRTVLPPGRRLAVTAPITVIVEGATRRHALTVDLPEGAQDSSSGGPVSGPQVDGNPTRAASEVVPHLGGQAGPGGACSRGTWSPSRGTTPTPRATPTPPPASTGPAPLS